MSSRYFRSNGNRTLKGLLSSEQLKKIKAAFPAAQMVKNTWNSFQIILELQPSVLSEKYHIMICYEQNFMNCGYLKESGMVVVMMNIQMKILQKY